MAIAETPPTTPPGHARKLSTHELPQSWLTNGILFVQFVLIQLLLIFGLVCQSDFTRLLLDVWLVVYIIAVVVTATSLGITRIARHKYHLNLGLGVELYLWIQLALLDLFVFHTAWLISETDSDSRRFMHYSTTSIHSTYEDRAARLNLQSLVGTVPLLNLMLIITWFNP